MNVQAEKIELARLLLETDDTSLLHDIRALFSSKEQTFTTPKFVIDGVRKSQQQIKNGQVLSYDEVKKELDKI